MYALAADLIALVHLAYILFVVAGQVLILIGWVRGWQWVRNRLFRLLHLVAIGVVVLESWLGAFCPLTTWENRLRVMAGEEGYGKSFVGYWVDTLIFYDAPTWVFTLVYSVFFLLVVVSYFGCAPRKKK